MPSDKPKRRLFGGLFRKHERAPSEPPPAPPPDHRTDARRDDLVQAFDALALAGAPRATARAPPPGFVGGFNPGYTPLDDSALAPLPRPPRMPAPQPQSLTMQYASAGPPSGSLTMHYALGGPPALAPPRPAIHTGAHSDSALPPPAPASASLPPTPAARPARPRAASTPPSPTASAGGDATQCSGVTKAGKRCTRTVKTAPALSRVAPGAGPARFCFQHTREVLAPSGFYARRTGAWVAFADWVPAYVQADTQAALRVEMEKARAAADGPGYIYTFEIRDPGAATVQLKVGRAVNLVKRIDEWARQCGSKEQVLRGWYPGTVEDDDDGPSMMKGRVRAGTRAPWCHRLERLVHLELADLAVHRAYLAPGWPGQVAAPPPARKAVRDAPCADCGAVHKEIFEFARRPNGREWEDIVQPVIDKWGAFVEAFV